MNREEIQARLNRIGEKVSQDIELKERCEESQKQHNITPKELARRFTI